MKAKQTRGTTKESVRQQVPTTSEQKIAKATTDMGETSQVSHIHKELMNVVRYLQLQVYSHLNTNNVNVFG